VKRISVFGAVALALLLVSVRGAWAFGVKDVVAMHQGGVADSLVIEKIRHSGVAFHLNSKDIQTLQREGVSDRVVVAMLRTEDRHDYRWYGDYPWWGPRVVVGFDYGFGPAYVPWYGYRPYYGPRYFGYHGFYRPGFGRFGPGFHRR
jgi:hypothetical protein